MISATQCRLTHTPPAQFKKRGLQEDRCAACGQGEALRYFRSLSETAKAFRCCYCRSTRILCSQKRQDNQTEAYRWRIENESHWKIFAEDFYGWVRTSRPLTGRALEVGCSVGTFVAVGQSLGLQIEGIDIDSKAVAHGLSRGLPVRMGTIQNCAGAYDFILCNHVLEHISEPESFLQHAHSILAPGGAFVAAMPYVGLEARLKGSRWIGWDPLEHEWLYSTQGLSCLMARCGFDICKIEVRNGACIDSVDRYHHAPAMLLRFLVRQLIRQVADLAGIGCQIFIVALRRPCLQTYKQ